MAGTRKLGKTTDQRLAMLKTLTTDLILNGKEYIKVVKEETTEKRQKDMPSRLNARRKIMAKTNKVKDSEGNNIDLPAKLFGELAEKYATRQGGYTRIIKMGPRRGDSAERVIIELV